MGTRHFSLHPQDAHRFGVAFIAAGVISLAGGGIAAAATLADYPDFSDVSGLKLNGDAAQAGDALRLTDAVNGQTGTAFTEERVLKSDKSFKTDFSFSQHDSTSGGTQADGMAFFAQGFKKGAIGDAGGGLGFGSIGSSLAVEFDIFDNGDGDGSSNEVAVNLNGKAGVSKDAAEPPFQLYGGERHAWIVYKAKSRRLKVYISVTETKPASPLLSLKKNLDKVLDSKSFVGFTGATGGANAAQDVRDWTLTQ